MLHIDFSTIEEDLIDWLDGLAIYLPSEPESDEDGLEVRVQYFENGNYYFHSGDLSFDSDLLGYWGYGYLDEGTDTELLAKDMIEELLEDIASSMPSR